MKSILHSVFGLENFRHGQEEIVQAVVAGRDVLAVMATGSGKSLCYQLPAVATSKRCLVVSPLISLMDDQVAKLRFLKIPAAATHSGIQTNAAWDSDERSSVLTDWSKRKLNLWYVSPERIAKPEFFSFLKNNPPDFVAIDELFPDNNSHLLGRVDIPSSKDWVLKCEISSDKSTIRVE